MDNLEIEDGSSRVHPGLRARNLHWCPDNAEGLACKSPKIVKGKKRTRDNFLAYAMVLIPQHVGKCVCIYTESRSKSYLSLFDC